MCIFAVMFKTPSMKLILRLPLLLLLSLFAIASCNTTGNDVFGLNDLPGTYVGAMNVGTPEFASTQYQVQVTAVGASSVKISPSGSAGTEWTATISNIAGVYTCITCVSQNQITFTRVNGSIQLSYNYGDNNEQFAGVKQ